MGDATRAIERARADAGTLAQFDPSPEATLARRYEAAAERGMFRALRAIAELNREAGRPPKAAGLTAELEASLAHLHEEMSECAPASPPRDQRPAAPLASFRAEGIDPLASFRAGLDPAADPGRLAPATTESAPEEGRPRRPDLRKLNQRLARNRR